MTRNLTLDDITDNERTVLAAFVMEGMGCTGSETAEELIDDNMTWMSAADLYDALGPGSLGWSKQRIAGVMSSLEAKGLIENSGESARGAIQTDWYATDKGILLIWDDV